VDDDDPPRWSRPRREVALVALQAAVLTRRIFLPAAGRRDLAPEQWQLLLALALIESAEYEDPATSVESLAHQLTLDREHAHELLFALVTDGLVLVEDEEDEEDEELPQFWLSDEGWDAADAYIERARRFLPGWPPKPRSHTPGD